MPSKKILIVEDELMIAEDIQESLGNAGYDVVGMVATGPDALGAVRRQRPDLVLLDIRLRGDMDGIATAREAQQIHDCAVIYLTAYADSQTLQRAKLTSPFGYVLKPFREKELLAMVEITLYRHELDRTARERQSLFSQILNTTSDGIVTANDKGEVEYMNPAAAALTGWNPELAQGQPLNDVLALQSETGGAPYYLHAGESPQSSLLLKGPQGLTPVDLHVDPIRDARGHATGLVVNLYDISEQRRVDQAQEARIETLEQSLTKFHELIHLCASCKRARDHEGHTMNFESFLRQHFGMRISHGICPDCFKDLYPDYVRERA